MAPDPETVLTRLSVDLSTALGDSLLSLCVHGSWVVGDFLIGRSDLDVLGVLSDDPSAATLRSLTGVHESLVRDFPEWSDHVEVEYVSPAAVRDVLLGGGQIHPMVRISPGEPIHLIEASRHYLLNWHAALQHDRVLAGRSPRDVLPEIETPLVQQVVVGHLVQWPDWVAPMTSPGGQAYSVLTICRAVATLQTGRQLSKRAAADYGVSVLPEWAALIGWARAWWYAGGLDTDPGRYREVLTFVGSVAPAMADRYRERRRSETARTLQGPGCQHTQRDDHRQHVDEIGGGGGNRTRVLER
ncbi:MAG TPA: aminoglycoside adenylyltransferase domain-containing protein [Dermatophilaceae bacterium]|nr:aminoglycoside adenylyltransferase domain-containing protein [Dermatophilaceae bacterium]